MLNFSLDAKRKFTWITFEKYFIKAIEDFFSVSIVSSKHSRKLGEIETVMQTRDAVEGLHNCLEFPQPPRVFRWGYGDTEKRA